MSECCSCNTQRDENTGIESSDGNSNAVQKSFNADCVQSQTNASNGAGYAVGTMVWTLFDYYGEPSGPWPHTTSSFGQFDLCGFPKAASYWYQAYWLRQIADSSPDKTFPTGDEHMVHIVQSWDKTNLDPTKAGDQNVTIQVYTDAPAVELFVNGESAGTQDLHSVAPALNGGDTWAAWNVKYSPGNLTAVAYDRDRVAVAHTTRLTSGEATKIELSIDVPSVDTGTGTALVLDGSDTALLRASIVDAKGVVVHMASHNVSFRVVSGPGRVVGAHNGDQASHEPNHAPWHSAYHGLCRGTIMVTEDRATPLWHRKRMREIDGELTDGPIFVSDGVYDPAETMEPIVVEASTPGLPPAQITIPTSIDIANDGVLAIAAKMAGKKVVFN